MSPCQLHCLHPVDAPTKNRKDLLWNQSKSIFLAGSSVDSWLFLEMLLSIPKHVKPHLCLLQWSSNLQHLVMQRAAGLGCWRLHIQVLDTSLRSQINPRFFKTRWITLACWIFRSQMPASFFRVQGTKALRTGVKSTSTWRLRSSSWTAPQGRETDHVSRPRGEDCTSKEPRNGDFVYVL